MHTPERPHSVFYLIPLILAAALGVYVWQNIKAQEIIPLSQSLAQGKSLPLFNLPSLSDSTLRFTPQTLQGKVSLLNVWASWCTACANEHTVLMKIKNQYHVALYGLDYRDNIWDAKNWLEKMGNPYNMVGIDSTGAVGTMLDIYGTPETFLIDQQGMIRYVHIGALTEDAWKNELLPLLKKFAGENHAND